METDAPPLGALRAGDAAALERLARECIPELLRLARRLLPDESRARDAVARAFRDAQRCRWRFEGTLEEFLRAAVAAAAIGRLRIAERDAPGVDTLLPRFLDDGHHEIHPPDWAGAAAPTAATRAAAREALRTLPCDDRAVLLMRDVAGLGSRETARGLGLPEDDVKRRLHRARQALRALIEPHLRGGAL